MVKEIDTNYFKQYINDDSAASFCYS